MCGVHASSAEPHHRFARRWMRLASVGNIMCFDCTVGRSNGRTVAHGLRLNQLPDVAVRRSARCGGPSGKWRRSTGRANRLDRPLEEGLHLCRRSPRTAARPGSWRCRPSGLLQIDEARYPSVDRPARAGSRFYAQGSGQGVRLHMHSPLRRPAEGAQSRLEPQGGGRFRRKRSAPQPCSKAVRTCDGLSRAAYSMGAGRTALAVRGYPFAAIKNFARALTSRASKLSEIGQKLPRQHLSVASNAEADNLVSPKIRQPSWTPCDLTSELCRMSRVWLHRAH